MAVRVGMINLGCAKNQVDGEMLLASLKAAGFEPAEDPARSDIAIVNTCGFIESAKRESIEEVLELAQLKKEGRIKKLVVTGCLSERYREEILREIPEADGVFGIGANGEIAKYLKRMLDEDGTVSAFPPREEMPIEGERLLTSPSWSAYIKIAEGCDNRCSYCAIPFIRGRYRSRKMESVLEEARGLAENGAKELVLIAQDTTRFGLDLYGRRMLPELLKELCGIPGIEWIRVLYCYPDGVTDELLEVMAKEDKVVKYMDLPLQHCSRNILKAMCRAGDRESLTALLKKIRERVPGIVLRTTLITGFPGETEEDFSELCEFVKDIRFERLGCFPYSQEEGTPAAELPLQIDEDVKNRRAEILMDIEAQIADEIGLGFVGKTLRVLTEGFDRYAECWFGRSCMDAPDVDGKVFFSAPGRKPRPGSFVDVKIEDCVDGDLMGTIAEEE